MMHRLQISLVCLFLLASCARTPLPLVEEEALMLSVQRKGVFLKLPEDTYVVAADGRGPLAVNLPPGVRPAAQWSPDGQWIATKLDDENELYLMRRDGSGSMRVTHSITAHSYITWSPDGTHLAYYGNYEGNKGIYIQDVTCIIAGETNCDLAPAFVAKDGFNPSWSPDGQYIVYEHPIFSSRPNRKISIVSINDPSQTVSLLSDYECTSPHWSPTSNIIALDCWTEMPKGRGQAAIYTIKPDGSSLIRLTDPAEGNAEYPRWSPDGQRLAFVAERDGLGENICWFCSDGIYSNALYIMDADGSNITRLSFRDDESISWYTWIPYP